MRILRQNRNQFLKHVRQFCIPLRNFPEFPLKRWVVTTRNRPFMAAVHFFARRARFPRSSAKNLLAFRLFPRRYSWLLARICAFNPGSCISRKFQLVRAQNTCNGNPILLQNEVLAIDVRAPGNLPQVESPLLYPPVAQAGVPVLPAARSFRLAGKCRRI